MKIGFIGCGNMASAMIGGILKKGIVKKEEIIVSNLTEAGSRRSREKLGVETTMDNRQVVTQAEIVFLAKYSGSGGRRHDSRLLQRPGNGGGSAEDQRDCRKLWKI